LPNDVPIGLEVPLLRDTEKISDIEIAREMFEKTTALCRSLI
jgi:hypothetical protein